MFRPIPYSAVLIDPMNEAQVQHWAKDMQVATYELRCAIRLVGPRLRDVRQYFGKSAHIIFLDWEKREPAEVSPYGLP
jgi:hypothetical protein